MNENMKKNLLTIINNQIKNDNPKCTKQAYLKIQSLGYSKKQSKEFLCAVLLDEIKYMMGEYQDFDEQAYAQKLDLCVEEIITLTKRIQELQNNPEKIDVFEMKVTIKGYAQKIYRVFLIPAIATVADLAYTIMSLMRANDGHLYNIIYNGINYDCSVCIEDYHGDELLTDATATLLDVLNFEQGDKLKMEYDFGEGWVFDIKVLKITKLKIDEKYPQLIKGSGFGILENNKQYFENILNETNSLKKDNDILGNFDLKEYQKFLQNELPIFKDNYELDSGLE